MYSLSRDVTTTDTESGLVLLDGRRGRYWQLNRSGATVLRSLLSGGTPEMASDRLRSDQDIPVERAQQDVAALIDALRSARLLEAAR